MLRPRHKVQEVLSYQTDLLKNWGVGGHSPASAGLYCKARQHCSVSLCPKSESSVGGDDRGIRAKQPQTGNIGRRQCLTGRPRTVALYCAW